MEWSGHLLSTPNLRFHQDVRTQTRPVRRSFTRTWSPPAGRRDIDISTSRLAWMINRFLLSLFLFSCSYTHSWKLHPRALLFPIVTSWTWLTLEWRRSQWSRAKDRRWTCRFSALCVCQTSAFAFKLYVYVNHRTVTIVQVPLSTSGLCYFTFTPTWTCIYLYIFNLRADDHLKGVHCYMA